MVSQMLIGLLSLLVLTLPGGETAHAQSGPFGGGTVEASLSVEPVLPDPYEEVIVRVRDAGTNLEGSRIDWFVDGSSPIYDAVNQRAVTITAPGPGESLTINATINTNSGQRAILSRTITPIYLDLVVEPQTRTPPFYEGRSLPSGESVVRLLALVNGTDTGARNLSYRWEVAGDVIQQGPIRGGNEVVLTLPRRRDVIVDVEVFNAFSEKIAERRVSLQLSEPEVLFYEVSSLYGLSRFPLERRHLLSGSSITIQAEPYHLTFPTYNQPDRIEWEIDGRRQRVTDSPYRITLERLLGSGSTDIEFSVRDTTDFLQGARGEVTVSY